MIRIGRGYMSRSEIWYDWVDDYFRVFLGVEIYTHVISEEIIRKKVHVDMYKMNVLVMVWISNDLLLDALLCGRRVGRSYEEVDPAHIRLHPQYLLHKNCIRHAYGYEYKCVLYLCRCNRRRSRDIYTVGIETTHTLSKKAC